MKMIFNFVCYEGKVYHDKVKNTRIVHGGNNNTDPLKKKILFQFRAIDSLSKLF